MNIPQPVINTFDRVGIDYKSLEDLTGKVTVNNWLTGETCEVLPLIRECIVWVYETTIQMESGHSKIKISDFDRVRYFILHEDSHAYMVCID